MQIKEQLDGTFATAGQEHADFIRSRIVPALSVELDRIRRRETIDAGDPAKLLQDLVDETGNEIAQAQLDANQQTAQATQDLRDKGGALGFQHRSQGETDLLGVFTGS